jgi:hypothetical protein
MKAFGAVVLAVGVALVPVTASAHSKGLTAYGATKSAWNSTHTMVTHQHGQSFVKDVCYDWVSHEANAGKLNGPGCLYNVEVSWPVTAYGINLPNHTSFAKAERVVLSQFPSDRHLAWTGNVPDCRWQIIQSNTLVPVMELHSVGEPPGVAGLVTVEYETTLTAEGSTVPFNPANAPVVDLSLPALASGSPATLASVESSVLSGGC